MRTLRSKSAWNEHVKLIATVFNAASIGIIGVAVIGPLTQPDNPFYDLGDFGKSLVEMKDSPKELIFTAPSLFSVIQWDAVGAALLVHVLAHLVMLGYRDD